MKGRKMGSVIRALNILSAVIMLATGIYIQFTFCSLLSWMVQSLIGVTVLLYFFVQIDVGLESPKNIFDRR